MTFDPQAFLDSAITSSLDTKVIQVPVGDYQALITKVAPRPWQSADGTKSGVAVDIFWSIEDAGVRQHVNREEAIVKQSIMLDITEDNKVDDSKGKNIGLGRLREAVGKNEDGQPFSFSMLPGLMAMVSVTHEEYKGENYAVIRSVSKA